MILATGLALLPLIFVLAMTILDLRPWWQQLKQIRALPEAGSRAIPTKTR